MEERDQFSSFDDELPNVEVGANDPAGFKAPQAEEKDDMVPRSRLNEVKAQRDELYGQREEMIKSMLNGEPARVSAEDTVTQDAVAEVVIPEGTDPEVAKLLTPIIQANNETVMRRLEKQFEQRVGPVEERINHADTVEAVRSRVEGFDDVRQDVVAMLEQMNPQERAEYSNQMGLQALTERALRVRAEREGARQGMAQSAPFGTSDMRPTRKEANEADVWAMSDEEFERALANKGLTL